MDPSALTTDLADLVLGRACLGCGRPGRAVCASCLAAERGRIGAFTIAGRSTPALAGAGYDGLVRQAILDYKERGNRALAPALGVLLADAVRAQLHALGARGGLLVPVPSHRRAKRGFDALGGVVRQSCAVLRREGLDVRVWRPIRCATSYQPLKRLGREERRRLVQGAFRPSRASAIRPPSRPVVVVDDVVTTGATVSEAIATLAGVAISVQAVAAIAVTSPGRSGTSHVPARATSRR